MILLKIATVKALAWQTSSKVVSQLFSFAVTILLARKLLPSDYGLVGMAVIFIGFLDLINEFGIGSSIIRKKDITRAELSSIFWFALFVGIGMFVFSYIAAPYVADFYKNASVTNVIRVLAFSFIIGALKTVPLSLLEKELMFKRRSVAEMVSNLTGGIVAISFAYTGWGVWSLVISSMVQASILTVIVFLYSSWKPSFFYNFKMARHMISFGGKIMLSRVQWYSYSNADYFIIGRLLGDIMLGYYTMAFRLATLPTEKITAIVNQVMFPAFAKLQGDVEGQRQAFLKVSKYVSMLTFPIMFATIIMASEIVSVALTEKWLPIVFPLRVLCLIGMIKSVDVVIPQLLIAKGKADLALKYTTILLITLPAAFLIGCYYGGLDGVAYAWVFVYPVLVSYLFIIGLKEIHLSLGNYLKNLAPQLIGTSVMGAIMYCFKLLLNANMNLNNLPAIIMISFCGLISYIGYFLMFQSRDIYEMKMTFMELRKKQQPCNVM